MKVTYIGHSGFLVELPECYLLFDYYEGRLPERNLKKPLFLFSSHFHQDHFNPVIFELLQDQKTLYGVFSKDIFESRTKQEMEKWFVKPEETYELPMGIRVETLRSTDKGVAFLVTVGNVLIYHGGDLNDWVWKEETKQGNASMTGRYRKEIGKLVKRRIDMAFVPLDPRQEEYYDRGILYFLKHTEAKKVVPMHFWKKPEIIDYFLEQHKEYEGRILPMKESLDTVSLLPGEDFAKVL